MVLACVFVVGMHLFNEAQLRTSIMTNSTKEYFPPQTINKSDEPHGISGCDFTEQFKPMRRDIDPGKLLEHHDNTGGIPFEVRKLFLQDLLSALDKHGVKYWLEEGTLIQAVRSRLQLKNEPPFMRYDDVDIGILDSSLGSNGSLAKTMRDLAEMKFEIIRCGPPIISVHRNGDYVDIMIFGSTDTCPVRLPDAVAPVCSDGIRPYVMNTHKVDFLGVPARFPGRTLLETTEYLEAMFGKNWKEHDVPNWNGTVGGSFRGVSTRGASASWHNADTRLRSKHSRFYLDPDGQLPDPSCQDPCPYTYQSVMTEGNRTVRMDDYPYPNSMPISEQQKILKRALDVFEEAHIPYILGVSPLHLLLKGSVDQHIDFLNSVVKSGYVCMHGFDHRTNKGTDSIDMNAWRHGGEFAQYNASELSALWSKGHEILLRVHRYTTDHFIPPFNAITQDMVDLLGRMGIKYIHSFDVALKKRKESATPHPPHGNFGGWIEDMRVSEGLVFVVSEWQKTYAEADKVIVESTGSQLALHWFFDKAGAFPESYVSLAKKLRGQFGHSAKN